MAMNKIASLLGFVVLTLSSICYGLPPSDQCLSYEPRETTITGFLERHTFPGPPNYENTRKGDRAETYWLIKLQKPACVAESDTDPDLNPRQDSVRLIQLVLSPSDYRTYRSLVGSRVTVSGSLFGAATGHHHTPVLLDVKSIAKFP